MCYTCKLYKWIYVIHEWNEQTIDFAREDHKNGIQTQFQHKDAIVSKVKSYYPRIIQTCLDPLLYSSIANNVILRKEDFN
jgi:hypothetical protein